MDKWFLQLFELIKRQKDTRKVEMLLPELYIEFDILARLENTDGLKDIYTHLEELDPFNTDDKVFNKNGYKKLKRELLKRLIILNDLTIIEDEARELVLQDDQKRIKKYLTSWKDHSYVHAFLIEYFDKYSTAKPPKKVKPKKVKLEEPIEEVKEIVKEEKKFEEVFESSPKEVLEIIQEKPKHKPVIIQHKSIEEPVEEIVKHEEIIFQGDDEVPDKEPIQELETKTDVKIKKEKKKSSFLKKEKQEKHHEPKEDIPPVESIAAKPIKEVEEDHTDKPIETEEKPRSYTKDFDGLMDLLTDKYQLTVNIERLDTLGDPRPNFYRILAGFIDSTSRDALFFIDLFKILQAYEENDFITYIAGKSNWLRKLCTMNIGLINVADTRNIFDLLNYLEEQEYDFIEKSLLEKKLRIYFDSLSSNSEMAGKIFGHASKVGALAPKQVDESSVFDSVDFFNKKVISSNSQVDLENPTELYWSIILATGLCTYVLRYKDYDFTSSLNCINKFSIKLISLIENKELVDAMVILFKTYLRNIYKFGTKAPGYEDWWKGQKDSMLDAKLDAIGELNQID